MNDEQEPPPEPRGAKSGQEHLQAIRLDALEEGRPTLVKVRDGDAVVRLICIREGEAVHALDDRCPHQGYPLSQGTVRGCVLTCSWHNWKFDVRDGSCMTGGDGVRRYPTTLLNGVVYVDTRIDVANEIARVERGLREALLEADVSRGVREGLRLDGLQSDTTKIAMAHGISVAIDDAARRTKWGFDHAMAMTADLATWIERGWVDAAPAFVRVVEAIGQASLNLPERDRATQRPARTVDSADVPGAIVQALTDERRGEAEWWSRDLAAQSGARRVIDEGLIPFVATELFDYGHGAIFLHKARELCERFPAVGEEIVASVCVNLSWATAETALPPFASTRAALSGIPLESPIGTPPELDVAGYEQAVLASERQGARETLQRLLEGVEPMCLLRAAGRAAAERLFRFDDAWEQGPDIEASVLDVTHVVTFVEAAMALANGATFSVRAALSVQAAGFVGRLHRGDRPSEPSSEEVGSPRGIGFDAVKALVEAAHRRDEPACLEVISGMDVSARLESYRRLAPFAAFDARTRPIHYAHTVKVLEALYRLESADPEAGSMYLCALIRFMIPVRAEIQPRRIAAIAQKFLADGRPPKGLY